MAQVTAVTKADQDLFDRIGRLSDRADNFAVSAKMPGLSASIHASCLADGMNDLRDELRQLYVEKTGENPWATQADETEEGDS